MIEIEQSGSLNTIQDLGRPAWRHLGVSVSGVMDPLALRAGNTLLGNEENAAAIEVQMFPFRVRCVAVSADSRGGNYSAATCCPVVPGRGRHSRIPGLALSRRKWP